MFRYSLAHSDVGSAAWKRSMQHVSVTAPQTECVKRLTGVSKKRVPYYLVFIWRRLLGLQEHNPCSIPFPPNRKAN